MRRSVLIALAVLVVVTAHRAGTSVGAQAPETPRTIEFVRDVQPIFQKHCYECHGPEKQSNGFRLDRRRNALIGGTEVVIGRGSAASSRLYLRLIGSDFGEKMLLFNAPAPAEIYTVKTWLDA